MMNKKSPTTTEEKVIKGKYYAEGLRVYRKGKTTIHADGTSSIQMDFMICEMNEYCYSEVSSETPAQVVAKALNDYDDDGVSFKEKYLALKKMVDELDWYWDADNREYSYQTPEEIVEDRPMGEIAEVERGGVVETLFYVTIDQGTDEEEDYVILCHEDRATLEKMVADRTRNAVLKEKD